MIRFRYPRLKCPVCGKPLEFSIKGDEQERWCDYCGYYDSFTYFNCYVRFNGNEFEWDSLNSVHEVQNMFRKMRKHIWKTRKALRRKGMLKGRLKMPF